MNEEPSSPNRRTTETVTTEQKTEPVAPTPKIEPDTQNHSVFKATQIIWYVAGLVIALLMVRAALALLGANLENGFANFIYAITDPFVAPFRGLLQVGEFQAGVSRLEVETLLAAAIYALATWGIVKAIALARK